MADGKKGVNAVTAAAIGAVVGAAAGAAAVALSDKENRRKIAKKLKEYKEEIGPEKFNALKRTGRKALEEFKQKVNQLRNRAGEVVEDEKENAKKKLAN